MPRDVAHRLLFTGQHNIALMAREVGCPVDDLMASFRAYVAITPIDEDVWRGDVDPAWPWA